MTKPLPSVHATQPPMTLRRWLEESGYLTSLAVQRQDGTPLTEDDRHEIERLLAAYDLDHVDQTNGSPDEVKAALDTYNAAAGPLPSTAHLRPVDKAGRE